MDDRKLDSCEVVMSRGKLAEVFVHERRKLNGETHFALFCVIGARGDCGAWVAVTRQGAFPPKPVVFQESA
ncbi:hypothetical protein M2281_004976 [Mesorhizobium soli]|uniref:hypothetical protein n=1 Tax=Pseudaminobacter soli (ex Li et al. 2025) TaxID=1295366 RepID=UPI002475C482|nr:hypothetical protein [Mesorhizobium soli]MDH6234358.1 hypothetical protein [Mesorhizobium soli]